MIRLPLISVLALIAIAACSSRSPVDSAAKANVPLPAPDRAAPTTIGESHGSTTPADAAPRAAAVKIPTSLHGRWALAPSDCNARPGASSGLLIVTADNLHFNASQAVPASDVGADPTSIGGNFAFTGEGRSWTKYEALKFINKRLTRTEINPTASFSYAKCS